MSPRSRRPGSPGGFTLIELLVVIAIIAILAGVVAVNVMNKPAEARVAAAKIQLKILKTAVQMYQTEQGAPPTLAQGLEALVRKPVTGPIPEHYPGDGYLDSPQVPHDPWDRPYLYLVPSRSGRSFEIITYGSDGEPGGEGEAADLSSEDL